MHLALFDFDGTITHRDSLTDFIPYAVGWKRFCAGLVVLTPALSLFALKLLANDKTKEIVLKHYFCGWPQERFLAVAEKFANEKLPSLTKPSAMERIRWHKQQNHTIAVVSASPELYLLPWCRKEGLELIGTRLEIVDGKMTGKLDGANCHGREKIQRIRKKYDLTKFERIYAYGDSESDRCQQEIAHEFHFRSFP